MVSRHEGAAAPTVVEDDSLTPLCPHCDKRLTTIRAREVSTSGSAQTKFGKRYVYACPACNKLLGVTHRKGFWMG